MVIVTFTDPAQWEYLCRIIDGHSRAGIPSAELPIAADTFIAVMQAKKVPVEQDLGKARISELGPSGVALEFEPK